MTRIDQLRRSFVNRTQQLLRFRLPRLSRLKYARRGRVGLLLSDNVKRASQRARVRRVFGCPAAASPHIYFIGIFCGAPPLPPPLESDDPQTRLQPSNATPTVLFLFFSLLTNWSRVHFPFIRVYRRGVIDRGGFCTEGTERRSNERRKFAVKLARTPPRIFAREFATRLFN